MWFLLIPFILSCVPMERLFFQAEGVSLPNAIDVSAYQEKARAVRKRVLSKFLLNGYVVSKKNGSPEHMGDAALWTSIAAASSPCSLAIQLLKPILQSITDRDGLLLRIDPLPESHKDDPTSRDMEVGLIFGIVSLYFKCPTTRPLISDVWIKHVAYVKNNGGKLSQTGQPSKTDLRASLSKMHELVSDLVVEPAVGPMVVSDLLHEFGDVAASVNYHVNTTQACYPLHLTTLTYMTLMAMGHNPAHSQLAAFCSAGENRGLDLTDWLCQTGNPEAFLADFEVDQALPYKHQRCDHETDNTEGLESPGIDFLVLYAALGGFLYGDEN